MLSSYLEFRHSPKIRLNYSLADCSVKPSRPGPSGWFSPES